ncbi:hypothetical protein [Marinobacter alexandrii]|uniref:hypothetical protein n=1 Tax=Marinobacter alexandrii TaxID=2570351 RepID=UPI001107B6EB|nr:hypothetical protein [Marinobacter alexandrii]
MNRFAMMRKSSHEVGTYLVVMIIAQESREEQTAVQLLLQSESGSIRAFLALQTQENRIPGLYERIFALLLILHFGQPPYGFIEEFVQLPDIL